MSVHLIRTGDASPNARERAIGTQPPGRPPGHRVEGTRSLSQLHTLCDSFMSPSWKDRVTGMENRGMDAWGERGEVGEL